MSDATHSPLEGLRIIDFSELLPGPFMTQSLVELGARVIKVERPGVGDNCRTLSPGLFRGLNRGKETVALNLKSQADRARAIELVKEADVLVEGYRPGVMKRLGLGPQEMLGLNTRLIYLSLSGYGATGPMALAPGHDVNYLALSGVSSLTGDADGPPDHCYGLPAADLTGALYGLISILSAVLQRQNTGVGQHLDVSMTDCMAHCANVRRAAFHHENITDRVAQRHTVFDLPAYGIFSCADGEISIGALEPAFWEGLKTALRLEIFGERFATFAARKAEARLINATVAERLSELSRSDAIETLERHGVPVSPVLSLDETIDNAHFRGRALFVETGAGPLAKFPVRLQNMPPTPVDAPKLS